MVPTARRYLEPRVPGNRCNHDPKNPRLNLDIGTKTRGKPFPWIILMFLARLEWLFRDRKLFPELGPRKRSERIEAMVLVGRALGRNLDRLTLRCGRRNGDGTFTGITMRTVAAWTKLATQRAYRALWDLRDAGFIDCTQPIAKLPDGRRRGCAGIRQVRKKLFERLGLDQRLRRDRSALWTEERGKKLVETIEERRRLRRLFKESAAAGKLTERTVGQLGGAKSLAPTPRQSEQQLSDAKRLITHMSAVSQEFPDWSSDAKRTEARARFERENH
jgi:hypothetical protein